MPKEKSKACPACGIGVLEEITGKFSAQIDGPDGQTMTLSVPDVTWRHCDSCGEDLLDDHASARVTRAHREALKLLTAEEIRSIRHKLGKTQAEMGELLGIGEKTYCRWESGTHFQSEAFDRYLRLLDMPEVVDRLNEIRLYKEGSAKTAFSKFHYIEDLSPYENVSESRKRCSPASWFAKSA
jgi:putative zinc finger/helix-turn-helix YgiT family protein